MIDSFGFEGFFTAEGDVDPAITAFWPYVGSPADDFVNASAGTWTLTVIGMILTFLAIVGWVYMDDRMLTRHVDRLRAAGFGRPGAGGGGGTQPPGTPGA